MKLFILRSKIGDIIWGMAVVSEWARQCGQRIDFMCAEEASWALSIVAIQPYIGKAFAAAEVPPGYDDVRDAAYPCFPDRPLPLFDAKNVGITMPDQIKKWIVPPRKTRIPGEYVTYGFNAVHAENKRQFMESLINGCMSDLTWVNTQRLPLDEAADIMAGAMCFLGCRSGQMVLAHSVGCPVVIYEPESERNQDAFKSPWAPEPQVNNAGEANRIIRELCASRKSQSPSLSGS